MAIFGRDKNTISRDALTEKYLEITSQKGGSETQYRDYSSPEVWMLIGTISSIFSQKFIKEYLYKPYEDVLFDQYENIIDERTFNKVKAIKQWFKYAMSNGYWVWMAEAILKNETIEKISGKEMSLFGSTIEASTNDSELFLKKLRGFEEKWRAAVTNPLRVPSLKNLSPAIESIVDNIVGFILSELEIIVVEPDQLKEIKNNLNFLVMGGYAAGIIEFSFRKK